MLKNAFEDIERTLKTMWGAIQALKHGKKKEVEDRGEMTPERAERIFMMNDAVHELEHDMLRLDAERWALGEVQTRTFLLDDEEQ